ncbi:MAG: hypothetical protein KME57_24270 [Scytonema hyalinum WJT4-NPBG1]|nr:hypothetical protein [Scytonema hyalinum WJT4-NPBG1]
MPLPLGRSPGGTALQPAIAERECVCYRTTRRAYKLHFLWAGVLTGNRFTALFK